MTDIKSIEKKLSRDFELISSTYHESGHCIYGLLSFFKIQMVAVNSLENAEEDLGYTNYEVIDGDFENATLIRYIQMAEIAINYAGLAAEKNYYRDICGSEKFPMALKTGCSDDMKIARELIKKYNLADAGEKRYQFKNKLFRSVRKLLNEHKDAVSLVAHSLYAKKKLSFFDLKELLCKKSKHKDFWKARFKTITLLFDEKKEMSEEEILLLISN
jgi:hypothetical protein